MSKNKRRNNRPKAVPLEGATVADIISQLQAFPQDAILVFHDGDGGIQTVQKITQGKCYHAHPGAKWIGQYSFVTQENWDNPHPKDVEYYQQPNIKNTLRDVVELS